MLAGIQRALTELGLEPGCTADAVRRAYLRTIKKHNPEEDPAGFQRAREAYDLLRALPAHALSAPSTHDDPDGAHHGAGNDAENDAEHAAASAAEPVTPEVVVVPEVVPSADTTTWSEPYVAAKDPADAPARALRDHVAKKRWDLAKQTLDREFGAAAAELRAPRISPRAAVRTALEMHASKAHVSARHVTKLIENYVALRGGDMQVFGARHIPWFVAIEIDALGKRVPSSIRSALAAAMLTDGPPVATDRLQAAMRDLDWTSVKLLRESEIIAALFGFGHLDVTATGKTDSPGLFAGFFRWVDRAPFTRMFATVGGLFIVIGLLAWACGRESKTKRTAVQRELINTVQHLDRDDCSSAQISLTRAREARQVDPTLVSVEDGEWFTRVERSFTQQCVP